LLKTASGDVSVMVFKDAPRWARRVGLR